MSVIDCIKGIYRTNGLRGFYKGITASYFGISETVVHFVIYETLKRKLVSIKFKILIERFFWQLEYKFTLTDKNGVAISLVELDFQFPTFY